MGFYLELRPGQKPHEYTEGAPPSVFWALWAIAGFALLCMGLSAHMFLADLLHDGFWFDRLLVSLIYGAVPFFLLIGAKLAFVRRFVHLAPDHLRVGYRVFGRELARKIPRSEITAIDLYNQTSGPNLAVSEHDDPQYYYRGHWRVVARLRSGKTVLLDRNTERGMLRGVFRDAQAWFTSHPG